MNSEIYKKVVANVLMQLGVGAGEFERWDDDTTAIFADQLRQIEDTLYRTIFPELRAQDFVPFDTTVNKGAEHFGYYMLDAVGMAKLIKNYADDIEDVAIKVNREFVPINGLGTKYSWSIQDTYNAMFANIPLTTEKADVARMTIAEKIDDMAVRGEEDVDMYGLTNHPNVQLFSPSTGDWLAADGSIDATGLEMLEDVKIHINSVNKQSKKALKVTNWVTDPDHLQALGQTFISSTANTSKTVLEVLKEIFPGVTFEEWSELENADAAGTGVRCVAYHKAPMVLSLPVPIIFEQLPPQARGFMFEVPCHGRVGGIVIRYPMAIGYMDGC